MDIAQHDFRALPTDSSSPSAISIPSPGSVSNTQLAALLADAYRDNDSLRKELVSTRKRAEKAERIIQVINSDPIASPSTVGGSATNGGAANTSPLDVQQLQQRHAETIKRLLDEYDEQVRSAQMAREDAETRRRGLFDGWEQVERYLADLELRAKDARSALSRIASSGGPVSALSLPGLPSPITLLSASASPSSANPSQFPLASMGPPGAVPSHRTSRPSSSRTAIFPVLPPHPNSNPPGTSHPPGTRRPRTPSLDAYAANQPPTKRSRANADDQRGRESRTSYSESSLWSQYIGTHDYPDQPRQRRHPTLQEHPEARIIDRNYGSYQAHAHAGYPQHARPSTHSRSGSHSSASSLDVDEMLLRATTGGEEQGALLNANGARYYDVSQSQGVPSGRRKDTESPRPVGAAGVASPNHYQPAPPGYPTNPSSGPLRGVQGSQGHVYTTHVFAPVVTGAPTKKSKFPNTALNSGPGIPGSGSSDNAQGSPVTAPFAATNAQGQRICRQCGMVGRYKDGKCVEKWGPGPMGPGTVCDRCRKKMKRVERRGTLENQQLQNAALQQFQPRPTSLAQVTGGPQSSDRTIQRSDTLLINQPSLGAPSFTQPRLEREEDSHQRSSTRNPGNTVSPGKNSRHPPTPPAIASLREQDDDDEHDDEHDEQPPTSNVGRGSGRAAAPSAVQSRSNSRNDRGNGNTNAKKLGVATINRPSNSPAAGDADVDEVDADADADAEADGEAEMLGAADGDGDGDADADADAELLEAVDAAEASGSSHGGERSWFKSEA